MSQRMTNPTKWLATQGRVRLTWIFTVSSVWLRTRCVAKGSRFLRADSKDRTDWADTQVTTRGKQVILLIFSCDGSYMQSCRCRSNYSRSSIARTRWWSIWVRTNPCGVWDGSKSEYDVACLYNNSPILTTEDSNNWPKLKYLLGRFFYAVWNKWIFPKKKNKKKKKKTQKKNRFLITYAITFSNFVLSFGSHFCRLQKHRCNV